MKWKSLKFIGVYVIILGITVEIVTRAFVGQTIITIGCLVFAVGANKRLIDFKRKYYKLLEKYKARGGE